MTVETIRDREIEMINYIRNTVTDPSSRGTAKTDTFTATAGQTVFTLTQTLVKNITSVTVASVTKYIGYDYTVQFGTGTGTTTVTLRSGATVGQSVVIVYRYGDSMIYEGYGREDNTLPRIAIVPQSYQYRFMSIGEQHNGDGTYWMYCDATYTAILRSNFALQMKTMTHDFTNTLNKYRQSTPQAYNTVIVNPPVIMPEDFDNELRLYQSQTSFTITWMIQFK